jgi:hypothetical protein
MSKKMSKVKLPFKVDERNISIIKKVCSRLYFLTIYFIVGDILYRQFILHQKSEQYEDLSILLTANVLLFIASALYYGGVSIGKIRFKNVLTVYAILVAFSTAFTIFKYKLKTFGEIFDKFIIFVSIGAILIFIWLLFAYFGKRKVDKEISDE